MLRTRFRMVRLLAIAVCTVWLVVTVSSPSWAQFSLPSLSSSSAVPTTIRNASYLPYECGRLLCSRVYLYGSDRFPTLILAEEPKISPDNGQVLPSLLAQRSQWLQDEFTQLVDIFNYHRKHQQWGVNPAQPPRPRPPLPIEELIRLSHLDHVLASKILVNRVPLSPNDLHPDTPKINIGTLNQETVLIVPEQLSLTERLLLTVTAADARHNERRIEDLAAVWRDWIRLTLSTAIAEEELLDSYALPWLGPQIAGWLGVMFVVLVIGGWLRSLCHWGERRLRQQLRNLQRDLAAESELDPQPVNPNLDATTVDRDVPDVDTTHPQVTDPRATGAGTRDPGGGDSQATDAQRPEDGPGFSHRLWGSRWQQGWARGWQQSHTLSYNLGQQVHEWVNVISHQNLHRQGWLSQQRNLVQLLALVLRWFQIWAVLYGIGEIIFLFPGLRLYSHLLIPVAIRIPILWMVIGFVDKTVDFVCDAALSRWAWRSALNNSSSQRYPLRVSTYSPAIHGATTFVANCIGGYFTIRMLNINPAGLASIGAVAVAATFLSRNLIEGILNGVLILWTDRYAVGDAVEIHGEVGIVEDMNLYMTVVRGREGRAIAIPNGQITTVANLSKDWSRVDLRVAIDHEADVEAAKAIIMDISAQLHADPDWAEKVIEPAIIMGVDDLSHFGVTLLIWMKTQPLQHWSVGREFRLRLKKAFAEHNITLAMPRQAVYYQSSPFPAGMTGGDCAGINALDVD